MLILKHRITVHIQWPIFHVSTCVHGASPVAQLICLQCGGPAFDPWVGKIPWRREWLPTPVFSSGEFHEKRRLAGYRQWGRKESDTTE